MSDLDEEELKATKEMKAINKIIVPEEKSADEMFDELGYKKTYQGKVAIVYENNYQRIEITNKTIAMEKTTKYKAIVLTQKELKAINKKCKELE